MSAWHARAQTRSSIAISNTCSNCKRFSVDALRARGSLQGICFVSRLHTYLTAKWFGTMIGAASSLCRRTVKRPTMDFPGDATG